MQYCWRATIVAMSICMLMMPNALAISAVELGDGFRITETDLGLQGVAIDPDGESVLIYGNDAYIRYLDAQDPSIQIELLGPSSKNINDADFHPGGQTAFLVGEEGMVLRYAKQDHSVEKAASESSLMFSDISSVAWNTAGDWAYVGSTNGEIWRLRADANGSAEVHVIVGAGDGSIESMDCHTTIRMCVVASTVNGIGVIDRDHVLSWVGGTGYVWNGINCPSGNSNVCVAIAENQNIATIYLNPNDISMSKPDINTLTGLDSYFVGIERQNGDRSLIATIPASLIEHDSLLDASFPWLENNDVEDIELTSGRIIGTWTTGVDSGWIITNRGYVVPFAPPPDESAGLLSIWIALAIPLAMGMVVLSLVYSSSSRLQEWTVKRFGSKTSKKEIDAKDRKLARAKKSNKHRK